MKSKVLELNTVLNDHYLIGKEKLLTCIICKGIIRNPIQCSTCKMIFCSECIRLLLICPNHTNPLHVYQSNNNLRLEMPSSSIVSSLNKLVFDKGLSYNEKLQQISPYPIVSDRYNHPYD